MYELIKDIPDVTKGTIIVSIIGALVAFVTIITKDYWIPLLTDKRILKRKKDETFKKYSNPIIFSSISLLYRLQDIMYKGTFLLDSTPKNSYNIYKFVSTIYRFGALIGWIRASKIELSNIEVTTSEEYLLIEKAINKFEESLADGKHIEQSVLENLAGIWNLDLSSEDDSVKNYLSVNIQDIIDKYCEKKLVEIPILLNKKSKIKLINEISDLISSRINNQGIRAEISNENIENMIQSISRTESWIYRDWQSAIGDMMIKKDISAGRQYEVMGYKEFEKIYFSEDQENIKWILRITGLFKNLDFSIDDKYDARPHQFKNIYAAVYNLLETYSHIKLESIDLTSKALTELKPKN